MRHWGVMRNRAQFVDWKNMDCLKLIYIELGLHPEAIRETVFFSPTRANRFYKHEVKFVLVGLPSVIQPVNLRGVLCSLKCGD